MSKKKCFSLAFMLLLGVSFGCFAGQDIRFSGDWKFYRGDATGAQASSFSDGSWTSVCLPHTVKEEILAPHSYYLGICWYRKTFTPSASWAGKKVFLEFEAAMQSADVYLNGNKLTTHQGGYKPFVLDISGSLTAGSPNVIAVRLDNNPSSSFEPGKDPTTLDFEYWGGLYRNVNIHVTDLLHITNAIFEDVPAGGGVFVTYSNVTTASASVQVKTHIRNESTASKSAVLKTIIATTSGQEVISTSTPQTLAAGAAATVTQSLTVTNPSLWGPDAPNLYVVRSELSDGTTLVDTQKTTIGIRTISFSRSGFSINSKHMIFRGADRHQDYPYIGNAVPNSGQYRDALRMKEGGINFVRMSHYVQAESFVDACDKLGVMAMACIPGWHSAAGTTAMVNSSVLDVRNMIRLYRNHPSVILWEIVHNESGDNASYCSSASSAAQEEYPGNQFYSSGENTSSAIDVFSPTTQASGRTKGATETRPVMLSEYADYDVTGLTSRVLRSDGEAKLLVATGNHIDGLSKNRALSWLSGDAVWSMFDYQTLFNSDWAVNSGIADIFRVPKFSYYFYQSQRDPNVIIPGANSGPMVYIASFWNSQSSSSVKVFSNCEKVTLSLNGTAIATQSPDNVANLEHAPFTFKVSSTSGTLKAEGLIGSAVKATYTIASPGAASKMKVVIDMANQTMQNDGSDIAIVYGYIQDASGNIVTSSNSNVSFSVTGPGTLVGANPIAAQAGTAAILLRAGTTPGAITVTATSGSASGSASVTPGTSVNYENDMTYLNQNMATKGFSVVQSGNKLMIKAPLTLGAHGYYTFSLCTVQGRLIGKWDLSKNENVIAVGKIPYGIYVGQINGFDQKYSVKIVRNMY